MRLLPFYMRLFVPRQLITHWKTYCFSLQIIWLPGSERNWCAVSKVPGFQHIGRLFTIERLTKEKITGRINVDYKNLFYDGWSKCLTTPLGVLPFLHKICIPPKLLGFLLPSQEFLCVTVFKGNSSVFLFLPFPPICQKTFIKSRLCSWI